MNKLQAFSTLISKPDRLKALLSFGHKGYLASVGWFNAFDKKQAVDASGEELPWVTYSFIDFIKGRLNNTLSIFEYGSGTSTLFYARRVAKVVSVEHDKNWYDKILSSKPSNAEMIFTELHLNGEYSRKAASLLEKFDIIIVDGRDRVNCCKHSVEALSAKGVLVLDDSERPDYAEARSYLKDIGFKELSFSGISPGLFYLKATSVFYRTENCLDI
ncbi:MAG: FkbM family methyltransferase [Pedobacter sp.]|nr:FkbM family methyltransferase [Pedobacter sp.]